jgi:AcrR family transcriptional regulator
MNSVPSAADPQKRILQAATALFAAVGFSGASTRDIARMAVVNDATVYRHFRSKRDLFAAVLEAELQELRIRSDLLMHVPDSEDSRPALCVIFELLTELLAGQPRLLRLLQFSVLEFGSDLQPLYQKYLGDLLERATAYLESCRKRDSFACGNPRAIAEAFAVTVVGLQTLHPLFGGKQISEPPPRDGATECTEIWHAILICTQASR